MKESDALIWERVQPKVSSSGSMNMPNPYCPAPVPMAAARNGTDTTHHPRYIVGIAVL